MIFAGLCFRAFLGLAGFAAVFAAKALTGDLDTEALLAFNLAAMKAGAMKAVATIDLVTEALIGDRDTEALPTDLTGDRDTEALPAEALTGDRDTEALPTDLTGDLDTEVLPTEALATEALATEALATEALAMEALATEALAIEALATEALATEALATEAFATEDFATEAFATEAFATKALATEAFLTEAFLMEAFDTDGFAKDAITCVLTIEALRLGLGERTGSTLTADLVSSTLTGFFAGEDFLLGDGERFAGEGLAGEGDLSGYFLGEGDLFGEGDLLGEGERFGETSFLRGELFPEALEGDAFLAERRGDDLPTNTGDYAPSISSISTI